ncbi:MAG: Crp/Fnr family transcriptional regulator [Cyclobacteriaceae bacterium]
MEKENIRKAFIPVFFDKKQKMLEYQRVADHFFFINSGLARLYGYKDGEEKTLFFFKENMIAGSMDSYIDQKPNSLILESIEPIKALMISREAIDQVLGSSLAMTKVGLRLTQIRLQYLLSFYASFVLDSPEERYLKFLKESGDLAGRVPQHMIASFLGITSVSLSRIRKRITKN